MKRKTTKKVQVAEASFTPVSVEMHEAVASTSTTSARRNMAGSIERTNRFQNIDDGLVPFRNNTLSYGSGSSSVDVRDAVILCQKCYYNFSLFRNIIDLIFSHGYCFPWREQKIKGFFQSLFKQNQYLGFSG